MATYASLYKMAAMIYVHVYKYIHKHSLAVYSDAINFTTIDDFTILKKGAILFVYFARIDDFTILKKGWHIV